MVQLSCGYKFLQVLLVIFNIVVFACGVGLIVVGSIACNSVRSYSLKDSALLGFVIFIIVLGCVLFILGSLGCCGACKKNVYKLTLYAILLSVIIAAEIAGGIAAAILKDNIKAKLTQVLDEAVQRYYTDNNFKKLMDLVQKELKCCGANSATDYGARIPDSCRSDATVYTQGCIDALTQVMDKYMVAISICSFIFAILQVLCAVFAICVVQAIKRGEHE